MPSSRMLKKGRREVTRAGAGELKDRVIRSRQPKSLVQFFRESPLVGLELDLEREKDAGRSMGNRNSTTNH